MSDINIKPEILSSEILKISFILTRLMNNGHALEKVKTEKENILNIFSRPL